MKKIKKLRIIKILFKIKKKTKEQQYLISGKLQNKTKLMQLVNQFKKMKNKKKKFFTKQILQFKFFVIQILNYKKKIRN